LKQKVKFILEMGRALHKFGTNAPRIESALKNIANSMGMSGNFFSTPTYLSVSIDSDDEQVVRHLRVNPGEVDLNKLCSIDEIATLVCEKKMEIPDALNKLSILQSSYGLYNYLIKIIAYGLTSLCLATLFGGGVLDISFSFAIGLIIGVLAHLSSIYDKLAEVFEFLAAFICTIAVYFLKYYFNLIHFQIIIMASLIVIIPGLNLTIAMTELAAKNLVSGTARLMGAMVDFFKISFGVMLGHQMGKFLYGQLSQDFAIPVDNIWHWPAILIGSISFTIIFNSRAKDFIWVFVSGLVAILTIKYTKTLLPNELAIFLAGFSVGIISNGFARIFNRPAMLLLLPGIIFLVPGSIGFQGLNLIFQTQYIEGIGDGLKMLVVAMTIVAGLFFANVFVNPRRSL
jgi:uncharacterized membrane protein YjjP (DUF1212 family)